MVLIEGKSPVEVTHNLGKPVGLLYKWIRKYKGIDSKEKSNDLQEEVKQLKNEIQELKKQLATLCAISRNSKKGGGVLRGTNVVKYPWIEEQKKCNENSILP